MTTAKPNLFRAQNSASRVLVRIFLASYEMALKAVWV